MLDWLICFNVERGWVRSGLVPRFLYFVITEDWYRDVLEENDEDAKGLVTTIAVVTGRGGSMSWGGRDIDEAFEGLSIDDILPKRSIDDVYWTKQISLIITTRINRHRSSLLYLNEIKSDEQILRRRSEWCRCVFFHRYFLFSLSLLSPSALSLLFSSLRPVSQESVQLIKELLR